MTLSQRWYNPSFLKKKSSTCHKRLITELEDLAIDPSPTLDPEAVSQFLISKMGITGVPHRVVVKVNKIQNLKICALW